MRPTPLVALALLAAFCTPGCAREVALPEAPWNPPTGLEAPPTIDRPIVDRVAMLTIAEREALESRLRRLRETTGAQMAVLLVATTGEEPIEDFSMRVAEAWNGGSSERDDGLLLTLAMLDRRMRLEVGYGLEARITDAEAQAILDAMRDDLRAGATARGIARAIEGVRRELPRGDASFLEGGALERPAPGTWAAAPFTLASLACVLVFLLAPRGGWPSARAWAALVGALLATGALLAFLYADLGGPDVEAAIAFLGSAAALVAVGLPIDQKARTRPSGFERWSAFVPTMMLSTLVAMGAAGLYLGGSDAVFLLFSAAFASVACVPWVLGALGLLTGSGGSYSGSSYSSSSYSSYSSSSSSSGSSSSSSSSYSGGGGGFGGGGASSSW